MKQLVIAGWILFTAASASDAFAQKKKVQDDIYYTAEDAKRDAEQAEQERLAQEEARRKIIAQQEADRQNSDEPVTDEYIDYDDDDYTYTNRFNRFNGPYYGGSYWAYDPFWYNSWYGPSWGWGYGYAPGWGISVGYGGPYWSSYWGYNCWYGYPGFYSAWNYPYYGGWGGYYGGGYYNGFYDGYYAGAYNGGVAKRNVAYGPRTSLNRYPGSLRGTQNGGQVPGGGRGQLRTAPVNESGNYRGRYTAPSTSPGNTERRGIPDNGDMRRDNGSYNQGNPGTRENIGSRDNNAEYSRPSRNDNNNQQRAEPSYQRAEPSYQRAEPAQQRAEPSYQRSQPSYQRSEPSRNYSSPSQSSPSRSGGSFGGGSRSGGSFGGGRGR